MIGAALGLASNAISGIIGLAQMNKANKQIKTAQNAQKAAMNEFKNIRETNPFAAVQVPTLGTEMAMDKNQALMTSALESSKAGGVEGAIAGTANITQAGLAGNQEIASQLGEAEYQRDINQATAQSGINQREVMRKETAAGADFDMATQGLTTAEANKAAGFAGLTKGITEVIGGIGGMAGLYGNNKSEKVRKDSFSKVKKTVKPNYSGGYGGDYGQEVNTVGLNSVFG